MLKCGPSFCDFGTSKFLSFPRYKTEIPQFFATNKCSIFKLYKLQFVFNFQFVQASVCPTLSLFVLACSFLLEDEPALYC
jgi:hypothetical protein